MLHEDEGLWVWSARPHLDDVVVYYADASAMVLSAYVMHQAPYVRAWLDVDFKEKLVEFEV